MTIWQKGMSIWQGSAGFKLISNDNTYHLMEVHNPYKIYKY